MPYETPEQQEPQPPTTKGTNVEGLYLGAIAYGATYLACKLLPIPVLKYLPRERRWSFFASSEDFPMGYYGLLGYSLIAFGLAYWASSLPQVKAWLTEERTQELLRRVTMGLYATGLALIGVIELVSWGLMKGH